jgi:hypothetical protein
MGGKFCTQEGVNVNIWNCLSHLWNQWLRIYKTFLNKIVIFFVHHHNLIPTYQMETIGGPYYAY